MRVLLSVATLASVVWYPLTDAFIPGSVTAPSLNLCISSSSNEERSTTVCDIPSEFSEAPTLVGVPNGANAIRSAVVTNSAGDFVRIGDAIKSSGLDANAPHVVIFLRHMG